MALRIVIVVLTFAAGFTARMTYEEIVHPSSAALAQEDQYDCASFGSQESAQAELDRDPSDPNNLDENGDGTACENYDYGAGDGSAAGDQYDDDTGGEITVGPQGSSDRTPGTGGPRFDVFPLTEDGDCPRPLVKRDGACYPG